MSFWGTELKPGKPFILEPDTGGKLFLTQATLGNGSPTKKSTLQVKVGDAEPIFICNLLPEKSESVSLNLEFDEEDEVTFSVVGPASIHISGIFQRDEEDRDDYDSDIYADDMAESGSGDSEFESEDGSEDVFVSDDDMPMFPPSSAHNSGVVIEEIEDDDKPVNDNVGIKQAKKKKGSADSDSDKKSQLQIVVKEPTGAPVLESEDEDGFPVSHTGKSNPVNSQANTASKTTNEGKKKNNKKDTKDEVESANMLKRKVDAMDQDEEPERNVSKDKKKQKKKKKAAKTDNDGAAEKNEKQHALEVSNAQQDASKDDKKISKAEKGTKESKDKPAKVRTFANGMKIEELQMGKPNGRRASNGKKVTVYYTGKLQKNGNVFDSSVGGKPFKFRLGVGQVIKGWDTGIEGMRIGDKRRLTIPPSFGYGVQGCPPQIPPNAWLVFDVELIDVA